MADYVAKHAEHMGRIELIRFEGDQVERLDLKDEETRRRVRGVSSNQHLRQLFEV